MSVSTGVDQVPAAGAVEAERRARRPRPRRRSTRPCCGSAAARRPARSSPPGGTSKPPRRSRASRTWRSFSASWRSYGQHLPRRARMRGHGLHAVGARLEQLHHVGLRERALGLAEPRAHQVARHGPAHEHHEAVRAADARAAVGERVDRAARRTSPRRGRPGGACVHRVLCWQPRWTWAPTERRPRSSSPRSTASTTCTTRGSRTSSRSSRSTTATRALFSRESVEALREAGAAAPLIEFAVQGLIGQEMKDGLGRAGAARGRARARVGRRAGALPLRRRAPGQRARPRPPRASWRSRATS